MKTGFFIAAFAVLSFALPFSLAFAGQGKHGYGKVFVKHFTPEGGEQSITLKPPTVKATVNKRHGKSAHARYKACELDVLGKTYWVQYCYLNHYSLISDDVAFDISLRDVAHIAREIVDYAKSFNPPALTNDVEAFLTTLRVSSESVQVKNYSSDDYPENLVITFYNSDRPDAKLTLTFEFNEVTE